MAFIISWNPPSGWVGYVTGLRSRPYTEHKDCAKKWTTRRRAERFLKLKSPQWAERCTIEELT